MITKVAQDQREVLYENPGHYHFAERNWGFIFIPIKDYREAMGLPVEAEDPKNPVLELYFNRDAKTPREATIDPCTFYSTTITSNTGRAHPGFGWRIFTLPSRILDGAINYISSMIKLP